MTARSQPIMQLIISLYVKNHPEECRILCLLPLPLLRPLCQPEIARRSTAAAVFALKSKCCGCNRNNPHVMWCKYMMSQEAPGISAPQVLLHWVAQEMVSQGTSLMLKASKQIG